MAETDHGPSEGRRTEGERRFKIRLKLTDRESGQSRYCTLDEAKTWDWGDPETWRMIGGWQFELSRATQDPLREDGEGDRRGRNNRGTALHNARRGIEHSPASFVESRTRRSQGVVILKGASLVLFPGNSPRKRSFRRDQSTRTILWALRRRTMAGTIAAPTPPKPIPRNVLARAC